MEQSLVKSVDRTSSTFRSLWASVRFAPPLQSPHRNILFGCLGMFGSHHFFHGVLQVQASSRPRSRGTTSSHGGVVFFSTDKFGAQKKVLQLWAKRQFTERTQPEKQKSQICHYFPQNPCMVHTFAMHLKPFMQVNIPWILRIIRVFDEDLDVSYGCCSIGSGKQINLQVGIPPHIYVMSS